MKSIERRVKMVDKLARAIGLIRSAPLLKSVKCLLLGSLEDDTDIESINDTDH